MRHQASVIGILAFVAACSGRAPDAAQLSVTTPIDCTLIGPVVRPALATLHPGDTLRAQADSTSCALGVMHFRWRSSDTTIGTVDSVSGLIRARSKGAASIIAEMLEDRTVKGAMLVQVVP